MNLFFFSFSDNKGGAAKASYSIYQSIKNVTKNCSYFCVDKKFKDTIKINGTFSSIYLIFLRIVEKFIIIFFRNSFHQSLNIFKSFNLTKINQLDFDILNLHWINRCSISLQEILKLKKNKFNILIVLNFLFPCKIPSNVIKKTVIIDPINKLQILS